MAKSTEYVKSLRGKDEKALGEEVAALRREQFNLRMQQATGQAVKPHLVREARKNIARVKTIAQQVKAK
ncbi:large subunit ribosomal protein L29 [Solimonas aquatica]|uniref:Large ribosomal subunit protein uL29 n=1 Tax=Solimonas aquatica TaxID=489703 RepID=A0A1H9JQR5_9GAMM|nr:50S ribosomal protein L29 [Solimonas aquatica]SEQ89118.1 large subunit ribosomal protein L29 [Solimonas aquatica]